MALDHDLNVALSRLRIIESALHGGHDWSFYLTYSEPGRGGVVVARANVRLTDTGVVFSTRIPAGIAYDHAVLLRDHQAVHSERMEAPGSDHLLVMTFEMEPVLAAA